MFLVNLSFIMHDPRYFSDPSKFNPGRFLDTQGKFVKNERVIPFGIGRFIAGPWSTLSNAIGLMVNECFFQGSDNR